MTEDTTHVVPAELETFAVNLLARADAVAEHSAQVKGIDLGVGSLGFLASVFTDSAVGATIETGEGIRRLGDNLAVDASYTQGAAASFRDNEQAQAGRFREQDHG